jgi:hypothetical protein
MNTQNNREVTNEIRDVLKLQVNDKLPDAIPTFEVNPKITKIGQVATTVKSSTGSQTILTTPANQDLYLTSATLNIVKDVTCDNPTGQTGIGLYINGLATLICYVPLLTTTAQTGSVQVNFAHPLKVDRNTIINITSTVYTVGLMVKTATISYYIDEASNA